MPSRLNEFVDDISGFGSTESIQAVDEDTVGITFDDPETFRPDVQTIADDAGVSLSDIQRTGDGQTAVMARDQNTFFDDPMTSDRSQKRVAPTDIQRQPDGTFTHPLEDTTSAPSSPARRGPDGKFVSNDLEDANIGRQERDGLFDLLR